MKVEGHNVRVAFCPRTTMHQTRLSLEASVDAIADKFLVRSAPSELSTRDNTSGIQVAPLTS